MADTVKAKTLYHSGLKNPTTLTVKSDALRSKFGNKAENEAGYEYVFVEIGGQKFAYSAENRQCASFLAGHKNETICVKAIGSHEDAELVLADQDESQEKQAGETAAPKPISTISDEIQKALNVMWVVEQAVSKEAEQAKISGVDSDLLTPDNFGGKCSQIYRRLEKQGYVDAESTIPRWSIQSEEKS